MLKLISLSLLVGLISVEIRGPIQAQAATLESVQDFTALELVLPAKAEGVIQQLKAQAKQEQSQPKDGSFINQLSPSGKMEGGRRTAASRAGHCEKASVDGSQPDRYLNMTPLLPRRDPGGLTRLAQPTLWFDIEGEIADDSTLRFALEAVNGPETYASEPFSLDAKDSLIGLSLPESLEVGKAYIWTLKVNCMDPEMDDMPIIMTGMIERTPDDYDPNFLWHDLLSDAVQQAGRAGGDPTSLNGLLEAAGLNPLVPATQIQLTQTQLQFTEK